MGKKKHLGWVILVAAIVAAVSWLLAPRAPETAIAPLAVAQSVAQPARTERFTALPNRDTIGEPRGQLFSEQSWTPPAPPARHNIAPPPPPPAVAPPPPYRVAGKVEHEGGLQVVLAKGDRVLTVGEGMELEDGYRVESIGPDHVVLQYLALGTRHQLPSASALAAKGLKPGPAPAAQLPSAAQVVSPPGGGPARLRWEGPKEVHAGSPFDVVLKITSDGPLHASPLQLSFDAEVLQPVNVRPGRFYADGNFSYRVTSGGWIFVGASGKGAVASDAEFVVFTFRPVRSGATAELKLSSLMLQGPAGRTVAHQAPGAFRIAIAQ